MRSFADVIVAARKGIGLTQQELATRLRRQDGKPFSKQYLANIEGAQRAPSDWFVAELARELMLDSDMLFHRLGRLPPDIRQLQPPANAISSAYTAMRAALATSSVPRSVVKLEEDRSASTNKQAAYSDQISPPDTIYKY